MLKVSVLPARENSPKPVALFVSSTGRSFSPLRHALSGIAGWCALSSRRKKPAAPSADTAAVDCVEKFRLTHVGSVSDDFFCKTKGPWPPVQISARFVELDWVMEVKFSGSGPGMILSILPVLPAGP